MINPSLKRYSIIMSALYNWAKRGIFILPFGIIFLLIGCSSTLYIPKASELTTAPEPKDPPPYLIQPRDQLDIKFFYNSELNETVTVRPDGKISLQLIDDVHAAGKSPSQLDKMLTQAYTKELKEPKITVIVRSFTGQQVFVGGEVNTQGLVELTTGMTPLQAVINAGGFKETAKPEETIIIRKGADKRPHPIRVDLEAALYGNSPEKDFQLKTFDIVYVPKSAIAKANKFVEQYIEKLFLFRGWDLSVSYDKWGVE
ncbi:MAG TPA: sugar transporter [Deltaproteobacteria bacterium]|nr:MAG: sugar transporter [Deltaproteobacteria bacterium]HDH98955.1 sugar transporter [Deltaproteobacteria bacterium]